MHVTWFSNIESPSGMPCAFPCAAHRRASSLAVLHSRFTFPAPADALRHHAQGMADEGHPQFAVFHFGQHQVVPVRFRARSERRFAPLYPARLTAAALSTSVRFARTGIDVEVGQRQLTVAAGALAHLCLQRCVFHRVHIAICFYY